MFCDVNRVIVLGVNCSLVLLVVYYVMLGVVFYKIKCSVGLFLIEVNYWDFSQNLQKNCSFKKELY